MASDEVVIDTGGLMVNANDLVGFAPPGSDTPTVKLKVPLTDGVPLRAPVEGFRVTPAGNAPLASDQVKVPSPPVAARVVE